MATKGDVATPRDVTLLEQLGDAASELDLVQLSSGDHGIDEELLEASLDEYQ